MFSRKARTNTLECQGQRSGLTFQRRCWVVDVDGVHYRQGDAFPQEYATLTGADLRLWPGEIELHVKYNLSVWAGNDVWVAVTWATKQ